MAEQTRYAQTGRPGSRIPDLLFLLDMVAAAPDTARSAGPAGKPLDAPDAEEVYYDYRTLGSLLYFFVHSSPLYREILLDEDGAGRNV